MSDYITASIFRFNPDIDNQPYYQEYRLKAEEPMTVLVLLNRIQEEFDETLSFRSYCCGLQMCQSCLMKINSIKKFACLTLVNPGERIVITPLTFPDHHIKDLMVKFTDKEQEK